MTKLVWIFGLCLAGLVILVLVAGPGPGAGREAGVPVEQVIITGCDMDLAADPVALVSAAVLRVNIWETADGGNIIGSVQGVDVDQARGSPGWCVGEAVSVLQRTTDSAGRSRVRIRTRAGVEGWITDFFLLQ